MWAHPVRALRPTSAADIDFNARPEGKQVLEIPTIQGQVFDNRVLERAAQFGVGRLDEGNLFGHSDRLADVTGLELNVHANVAIYFQNDVLAFDLLEPLRFRMNLIGTGRQAGSVVLSRFIRD